MGNTHVEYMRSFLKILSLLWLQIQSRLFIALAANPMRRIYSCPELLTRHRIDGACASVPYVAMQNVQKKHLVPSWVWRCESTNNYNVSHYTLLASVMHYTNLAFTCITSLHAAIQFATVHEPEYHNSVRPNWKCVAGHREVNIRLIVMRLIV